jgi:iron complex transport system substrate-binding protein
MTTGIFRFSKASGVKRLRLARCFLCITVCFGLILLEGLEVRASNDAGSFRTVVDQRGAKVKIPSEIKRVVSICDGFVEGVMTILGVQRAIVGLGSSCVPKHWEHTYPTVSGESYTYTNGMNTVTHLNPRFMELPVVIEAETGVNYETLAGLHPDVVFLRAGDCMLGDSEEKTQKAVQMIEALGIPLIFLRGPNKFDSPDPATLSEEIRIVGRVFGKEQEASELAVRLENMVRLIAERTRDIPNSERVSVLVLGLSPKARSAGGAGEVRGLSTVESYFVEDLVHANNAYRGKGAWNMLGAEHVLALDPDVIVLMTSYGYHPPRELYEAPYYQDLKELKAVKGRRVTALPWTPCNCQKRVEYPIEVMVVAKAAYPERFADIDLNIWLLDFYQQVYGVDRKTAEELRAVQWMDWATP